jgi:hypothetical protein
MRRLNCTACGFFCSLNQTAALLQTLLARLHEAVLSAAAKSHKTMEAVFDFLMVTLSLFRRFHKTGTFLRLLK